MKNQMDKKMKKSMETSATAVHGQDLTGLEHGKKLPSDSGSLRYAVAMRPVKVKTSQAM